MDDVCGARLRFDVYAVSSCFHAHEISKMSKYDLLWKYIGDCGKDSITLTFDEVGNIADAPIDHSFLRYKKELTDYGYEVKKISMKERKVTFEKVPKDTLALYIPGKGGTADEAEHYKPLFPDCDVAGLDYKAETPWDARTEFAEAFNALSPKYGRVILIANSIGAYFSMCALPQEKIERAYFISPIVDMEKLICRMMTWANVSEDELREKGTIATTFGETLSWEYLSYVRNNPACWSVPTDILYGAQDNLTDRETISVFAAAHRAALSVMEDGEHWFHTPKQMEFLDSWLKKGA